MVISSEDFEAFKEAAKRHNLRPLIREISSNINGKAVTIYEVIGLDRVTEYILTREMESVLNEGKL